MGVYTLMSLCIIVIIWQGAPSRQFVEVQTVEGQISDSDNSAGKQVLKVPAEQTETNL
jgi:hypothetical protein